MIELSRKSWHIARLEDLGYHPDLGYYYVMELLEGRSLDALLREWPLVARHISFSVIEQLCKGMAVAHEEGIIHCDLKPSNIVLLNSPHQGKFVKIVDFGIAKFFAQRSNTRTLQALGTPHYMSPEQVLNNPLDARSDIYALGTLLYHMIAGYTPFHHHSNKTKVMGAQIHEAPPSLNQFFPHINIPKPLDDVILRALDKDPEKRYPTVGDFWHALEPFEWWWSQPLEKNFASKLSHTHESQNEMDLHETEEGAPIAVLLQKLDRHFTQTPPTPPSKSSGNKLHSLDALSSSTPLPNSKLLPTLQVVNLGEEGQQAPPLAPRESSEGNPIPAVLQRTNTESPPPPTLPLDERHMAYLNEQAKHSTLLPAPKPRTDTPEDAMIRLESSHSLDMLDMTVEDTDEDEQPREQSPNQFFDPLSSCISSDENRVDTPLPMHQHTNAKDETDREKLLVLVNAKPDASEQAGALTALTLEDEPFMFLTKRAKTHSQHHESGGANVPTSAAPPSSHGVSSASTKLPPTIINYPALRARRAAASSASNVKPDIEQASSVTLARSAWFWLSIALMFLVLIAWGLWNARL